MPFYYGELSDFSDEDRLYPNRNFSFWVYFTIGLKKFAYGVDEEKHCGSLKDFFSNYPIGENGETVKYLLETHHIYTVQFADRCYDVWAAGQPKKTLHPSM